MITVTISKNSKGFTGFSVKGHAGYAKEGYDIICSAVSVLTVNAVNSIEAFTEDALSGEQGDGLISCQFPEGLSKEGELLMNSMVLGLTDIQKSYGKQYMKLIFEEV